MDKCDHREIPVGSGDSEVFLLEGSFKDYSTEKLHYHSCHQLLRIQSGMTLLVDEERKQPLFSSMAALIPAGALHRSVVMGEGVRYKSIYLHRDLLNVDESRVAIFDMSELGTALFDRIDGRKEDEELNRQCLSLLLQLVEREVASRSTLARIPLPHNPDNVKIVSYMEANFSRRLTLHDFATAANYSERHVSRVFKDELGISLFEYLKLYRIFRASLKLVEGDGNQTITEIAYSCGYDSLSSFYKDFKDIFSLTPKQFKLKL